jgi:hypothetical protein
MEFRGYVHKNHGYVQQNRMVKSEHQHGYIQQNPIVISQQNPIVVSQHLHAVT